MHTRKPKKHRQSPPATPALPAYSPAQLLVFFLRLLPVAELLRLTPAQGRGFYDRLFSPLVTLWYLLFQRLNSDHTLDAVVVDAANGGADALNPKLSAGLNSDSTSAYSTARQRIPLSFLAQVLRLQGSKMATLDGRVRWGEFTLALLDGTTTRLRPLGDIPEQFPAHGNQHGKAYWCLMRVVACFCALSGTALDCDMAAAAVSEQVLACNIILRCAVQSLFMGDRNFGVFRIAQAIRHAGQELLVRMTEVRAAKLLGRALKPGDYSVQWKHTRHDQLQPGCSEQPIRGRLVVTRLERPGFRAELICLFTTLSDKAEHPVGELVHLYGLRWQIELNLRYVKTQMNMVQFSVKSAEMARKEWLAGMLAYNLIRAAMLCAALHKEVPVLSLSFSASRRRLQSQLKQLVKLNAKDDVLARWEKMLRSIARCKHPRRSKPRPNEPRAQRHLRQPYPPLVGSRSVARSKLQKAMTKS
jgi:hypothetical protein